MPPCKKPVLSALNCGVLASATAPPPPLLILGAPPPPVSPPPPPLGSNLERAIRATLARPAATAIEAAAILIPMPPGV